MAVINPIDDRTPAWAAWFNAFANAHGAGGIVSGCSISKGTGDWDIDVTSGSILESNTEASISSGTETITDSSGLSSGQQRITLIHADTGDSIASTDGTAASSDTVTTPDIPANEVLLGFIVVSDTDSTVAESDIFDIPALVQNGAIRSNEPIYGDGSDGSITRSSGLNENGVIQATDYTLEAGNTATVTTGILVILSQGDVTINGTIDATGQGGSGGSGGASGTNTGNNGTDARLFPLSTGGAGGSNGGHSGGDGGDGDTVSPPSVDFAPGGVLAELGDTVARATASNAGAGGGGGGGSDDAGGSTGSDGAAPGGGGSGTGGSFTGAGGDGGDGGGLIVIVARGKISGSGTIQAASTDGADGSGGGGGGGGSGGVIVLAAPEKDLSNITTDVSKGTGGTATNAEAGDGADGVAGRVITV